MGELTPLMKQYYSIKEENKENVLFFRLGDFYEMFDNDAQEVSRLLNLTLTHRGKVPMCGIPYHAAKNYIKRLLEYGKKIAICEQIKLTDNPKELAQREVIQVITPATVTDLDYLVSDNYNFIMAIYRKGIGYCDISTGDFILVPLDKKNRINNIKSEIEAIQPREILVSEDEYFVDSDFRNIIDLTSSLVTKLPNWYFSKTKGYNLLSLHLGVTNLNAFALDSKNFLNSVGGCLLKYISETSKSSLKQINTIKVRTTSSNLQIDDSSRRNLELFASLYDGNKKFSLYSTINRCRTAGGNRLLKSYLTNPLINIDEILFRQKWVSYFFDNHSERERVRKILSTSMDMVRLVTAITLKRAKPHDLVGIKYTLKAFFNLIDGKYQIYSPLNDSIFQKDEIFKLMNLYKTIDSAINEECLGPFMEGKVILPNYDSELDDKRQLKDNGKEVLEQYLDKIKNETGISILKLGHNKILGYFLEVPKGQVSKVPDSFYRKQTLVNGERFTTDELKDSEKRILLAAEDSAEREKKLFDGIVNKISDESIILNMIGNFIATLDVFSGLAELAVDSSYIKPEILDSNILDIKGGRHPVVEKQLENGEFVPNDLDSKFHFNLITGPNMAGKSTYLRQNALIIILAQIGSYVPAQSAKIGIVDKIFCRVGASDNLARGESTFLIEMEEAAYILRNCTERSFVIMDEIGRGTSTQDGMSLAYAIMRDLVKKGTNTLFATHYHELTLMDTSGLRLLTLKVIENKEHITFVRKVIEGTANSSYGIHVAKMAGLPNDVVLEAKKFQKTHFADYSMSQNDLFVQNEEDIQDMPLQNVNAMEEIINEIKNFDSDTSTPVQALIKLATLKEKADCL